MNSSISRPPIQQSADHELLLEVSRVVAPAKRPPGPPASPSTVSCLEPPSPGSGTVQAYPWSITLTVQLHSESISR
jgi:hypothetical protein